MVFLSRISALIFSFILVSSCTLDNNISGEWVGYAIEQEDSTFIEAKPGLCSLYLGEQNYYFRGNTNSIEKGTYEITKNTLILTDTLRNALAKNIAFEKISEDSIVLTMNNKGKRLQLFMRK